MAAYRLPDEPLPSGLSRYVVDPMWPLLALMLGGNVLGLAWFVFNGLALGSPTRAKEWAYAAGSLIGCALLTLAMLMAFNQGWLQGTELRYAALLPLLLKLSVGYVLYMTQSRCFEVWEHYGGAARNGMIGLLLVYMAGRGLRGYLQSSVLLENVLL